MVSVKEAVPKFSLHSTQLKFRLYGRGRVCETASRDGAGLPTDCTQGFPLVVKLSKAVMHLILIILINIVRNALIF